MIVLRFAGASFGGNAGVFLACAAAMALGLLVFHAALPWPVARAERLRAAGRATMEWEWVHVPRAFARRHRLYRLGFGIYAVAVVIMATFAVQVWAGLIHAPWFAIPYGVIVALTLLFLIAKGAVAYPLVYLCLIPGLPFTLPAIVYWADGVRPNLIYRHRFERLCREEE
jgi:hypothetical protein